MTDDPLVPCATCSDALSYVGLWIIGTLLTKGKGKW